MGEMIYLGLGGLWSLSALPSSDVYEHDYIDLINFDYFSLSLQYFIIYRPLTVVDISLFVAAILKLSILSDHGIIAIHGKYFGFGSYTVE